PRIHVNIISCYFYLRYLHSFPTRRSSDLWFWASRFFRTAFGGDHQCLYVRNRRRLESLTRQGTEVTLACRVKDSSLLRFLTYKRSEEHTSELQSRGHLVCRLLLEKKKKTK